MKKTRGNRFDMTKHVIFGFDMVCTLCSERIDVGGINNDNRL